MRVFLDALSPYPHLSVGSHAMILGAIGSDKYWRNMMNAIKHGFLMKRRYRSQ